MSSDVLATERHQLAMETLGLNLSESKTMLEGVQDFMVARQAVGDLEQGQGGILHHVRHGLLQ